MKTNVGNEKIFLIKIKMVKKNKKMMVHLHNGILHSREKKQLLPFKATAWMELENMMLSEISQLVKDKHHMISPTRGI